MKRTIRYATLFSLAVGMLASCSSSGRSGKTILVTPATCVLTPDSANQVKLDLNFEVPGDYFSKRSRLVISPRLVVGDTVVGELDPLVVDAPIYGKKKERMERLSGFVDPYADRAVRQGKNGEALNLPYKETVQLSDDTDNALIVAVVSTDGCGECTGIDTVEVAAVSNPVTLMEMEDVKEALELNWIEPEFVVRPKVMEGKGVANLQFAMNRNDINLDMGDNRAELERMEQCLTPVLRDSLATLNSLDIVGMASADGSLALNTSLAQRRAQSAKSWLVERLGIDSRTQRLISTGSTPEGWSPVLKAMIADGNPDSLAVKKVLEKYADRNDDVQEYYIRRLPCWKTIRSTYLQKNRTVVYVYTYTLKSFTTDGELLEMYGKRPDAFNEDELLRVATLVETYEEKKEVYQTIMKYFPQSQVAANNLAVLYLRENREEEAREVLSTLSSYSPEALNTLAASYVYAADYERAIELLQSVELPEARYNLGLLKARQRKLREAYDLLRPFGDVNSAICALSVNENSEARRMLGEMRDDTPLASYVRAMVAARFSEGDKFFLHIVPACADGKLRRRAVTEPDFFRYRDDSRFVTITEKR